MSESVVEKMNDRKNKRKLHPKPGNSSRSTQISSHKQIPPVVTALNKSSVQHRIQNSQSVSSGYVYVGEILQIVKALVHIPLKFQDCASHSLRISTGRVKSALQNLPGFDRSILTRV